MTPEILDPRNLKVHPLYIRGKTVDWHVRNMMDKLDAHPQSWPFPPIIVQPIPASEEKDRNAGFQYYILDGHNRTEAAKNCGRKVPALVKSGLSPSESLLCQWRENEANGMALDVRARQRLLNGLKATGMNNRQISKETGLTESTVSRVLGDKAGTVAGTEQDKRTKKGKEEAPDGKKKPAPFNRDAWFKSLGRVLKGWNKHHRTIVKMKGFPEKLSDTLDKVYDLLNPEPEEKEKD